MSGADYFTFTPLIANTLARASDVNARMESIQGAFGRLPHYEKLQQGRASYVEDTGGPNSLVVNLDFAPASYSSGLELTVRIANTNVGTSTINVNGLGAKQIIRADGSVIQAGDLAAGCIAKLVYDGTAFRVLGASESAVATSAALASAAAVAAAASAAAAAISATASAGSATNAATSATAAAASAAAAAAAVAGAGFVHLSGDVMTGLLTLSGPPTANLHAATKKYVDDAVFAAGAYTADGATITLNLGQFALTAIADQRLLGNVAGSTQKPAALTAAQAVTMLGVPTLAAAQNIYAGIADVQTPNAGSTGGLRVRGNATSGLALIQFTDSAASVEWGHFGVDSSGALSWSGGFNASTATRLATARSIAISGAVTGVATSFDGTGNITIPITALDVGAATTGTLAVSRGGTGVTTSTGNGATVRSDSPALVGTPTAPTPSGGDNSTKLATTAFVASAIAPLAPLASPPFTGTPTAPTAAAGTATTQLATTAFVDGLRDVASNSKTANYTLALADRGQGFDFNGSSLTCTIPANSSVAFPLGATIVLTNLNSTALTVGITSDTLTMAGTTTTGSRTLAQNGMATLRKVGATSWLISGVGLS